MDGEQVGMGRRAWNWPRPVAGRVRSGLAPGQQYDLLLLAVLALLLPALLLLPLPVLRVPLGLTAALVAPGYALTAALFVGREDLDGVTRAALSCGLSVAVLPVLALLLEALSWGIRPRPMAHSLSVWIVLCCAIALGRRHGLAPSGRAFVPPRIGWRTGLPDCGPSAGGRYALAAMGLFGLMATGAVVLLTPDRSAQATEFYILGKGGRVEDYPRRAAVQEEVAVTVGIANRQPETRTFRVEVWISEPGGGERQARVAEHGAIVLAPGQTREEQIGWRMPWPGDDQRVEFWLLAGEAARPHRRLRLWLDVATTSPGESATRGSVTGVTLAPGAVATVSAPSALATFLDERYTHGSSG